MADSKYDASYILDGIEIDEKLLEHSKEFDEKVVYKVTEEVYVAVGYAIANSILIIAPDGAIIVDTTESVEAGRQIYAEFRKITDKPIKAFIYTHGHGDHTNGTLGFLDDPDHPPDVYGHHTMKKFQESLNLGWPRGFLGSERQFGIHLGERLVNVGIGKFVWVNRGGPYRRYPPNKLLYHDEQDYEIAGMTVRLMFCPGETSDQIAVWLPDSGVMMPGDNVYKAFPNLYAIRGVPPRNTLDWTTSVKKMRDLKPEHLVPSHTRPISGAETVYDLLTDYKDAIQFVHDQSLRYINQGLHPSEVVQLVKLPEHLANNPHLLEFYGTVEWSTRAVYDMYFGWFSGDPVELSPLPPKKKAEKMLELVGRSGLISAAEKALANGEYQWALELVSHVFTLDRSDTKARDLRLQVLRILAAKQRSAPGRNFFSTVALQDFNLVHTPIQGVKRVAKVMPFHHVFEVLKTHLKAELVVGQTLTIVIKFTDVNDIYSLKIHNCVLDVDRAEPESYDVKITTETQVWRELMAQMKIPDEASKGGFLKIEGNMRILEDFLNYFE